MCFFFGGEKGDGVEKSGRCYRGLSIEGRFKLSVYYFEEGSELVKCFN